MLVSLRWYLIYLWLGSEVVGFIRHFVRESISMDFMFQATIYELRRLPQVQILDKFHCHNSEFSARYKFYPTFFNGTWVSDTEILFRDRVG